MYGALGAWAGASAGLTLALLLYPIVMGVGLIAVAVIAIILMIYALVRGNADAGGKAVAVLCFVVLAGGLVVTAIYGFDVPAHRQSRGSV